MTEDHTARLFCIVARTVDTAVVFRRGPSKLVCMLRWDLRTGTVVSGQWLRARVYERRCDLSPDGRHLIYLARGDGKAAAAAGRSYTAVSRPPHFTAVALYGWGHAWNGGGLFLNNRLYWMDDSGPPRSGPDRDHVGRVARSPRPPPDIRPGMGEDMQLYVPRLARDGWQIPDRQQIPDRVYVTKRLIFEREVRPDWTLRKTFVASLTERNQHGHNYHESHTLSGPGGVQPLCNMWAEVHKRSVVFARNGVPCRLPVHRKRPGEVKAILETTPLSFRPVKAPYEGVRP